MPYDVVKSKSDTSSWRSLHALVQFGKETARFDFKPEGDPAKDEKNEALIGTSVRVNNEDIPDSFQTMAPGTVVEDVYVLYDTKNRKMISINPWEGEFDMVCFELGSQAGRTEDNLPQFQFVPKEETGYDYDIRKFYAAYEIIGEHPDYGTTFKGCKPRYHLQHKFVESQLHPGMVGQEGVSFWKGRRTQTGKVVEWTQAHEIDQDMAWPESGDTLPEFEQRILAKNKPVRGRIERGWIVNVSKARGSAVRVVPEEEPVEVKPGNTDPDFGGA